MHDNAAEIWLNAMYVNALVLFQSGLKIQKNHALISRSALCPSLSQEGYRAKNHKNLTLKKQNMMSMSQPQKLISEGI